MESKKVIYLYDVLHRLDKLDDFDDCSSVRIFSDGSGRILSKDDKKLAKDFMDVEELIDSLDRLIEERVKS